MPVIRTSLGIAYNVPISGMSDTMDIAYKNTLWSRKYVRITYIHCVCIEEPFSDDGSYIQYVLISNIHCLRTCSYNRHKIYMVYGNRFPV